MLFYFTHDLPVRLNVVFPWVVIGLYNFTWHEVSLKKRTPYITMYIAVMLLYLSAITHKEPKFTLPIFPLLFLMAGY